MTARRVVFVCFLCVFLCSGARVEAVGKASEDLAAAKAVVTATNFSAYAQAAVSRVTDAQKGVDKAVEARKGSEMDGVKNAVGPVKTWVAHTVERLKETEREARTLNNAAKEAEGKAAKLMSAEEEAAAALTEALEDKPLQEASSRDDAGSLVLSYCTAALALLYIVLAVTSIVAE